MKVEQYQPSPRVMLMADNFTRFFSHAPVRYNYDLGYRCHQLPDALDYRSVASVANTRVVALMNESHQVMQLVEMTNEELRQFPDLPFNAPASSGLISGFCGGRAICVSAFGHQYRAIVTPRGLIWLDRAPVVVFDPDQEPWRIIANTVEINLRHIRKERALLKKLLD